MCRVVHAKKINEFYVRFEVFTAVTMKKAVFWDVAPCRSGVNRRFDDPYQLLLYDITARAKADGHSGNTCHVMATYC
jgi:hypothetical protein